MAGSLQDEAAKLEAEMEARHAAELAAFDAPKADTAAAVALAGSLYSVHLDGEEEAKQPKVRWAHMCVPGRGRWPCDSSRALLQLCRGCCTHAAGAVGGTRTAAAGA